MINPIPIHFPIGSCSPKKANIQMAVNAGRMLLNAFACVTPIFRSAKQKRINAITDAKTVRYATQPNAVINCVLEIVHWRLEIAVGPSLMNQMGMKKQRLINWA